MMEYPRDYYDSMERGREEVQQSEKKKRSNDILIIGINHDGDLPSQIKIINIFVLINK